jgi:hypothetical protein
MSQPSVDRQWEDSTTRLWDNGWRPGTTEFPSRSCVPPNRGTALLLVHRKEGRTALAVIQ